MDDTKTRVAITVSKSFWYKVKLSALSAEMKLSEFVESKLMFAMQCDEKAVDDSAWKEGTADPPEPTEAELREISERARKRNRVDDKKRAKKKIFPNAIKSVDDIADRYKSVEFKGGFSKDRQVGKKGAK